MAKKEFIFQGFTTRTHVDAINELFQVQDIQHVLLSVAFVSKNGVDKIKSNLSANSANLTVFAGIRNDITSFQGLTELYLLANSLYVVDTGSRSVVFHPKIYLVRGKHRARLIIGSANLTLGGLHNNIEAGMILDFDLADSNDKSVVNSIEFSLNGLPHSYPKNVGLISSLADLGRLLADGRLVDESIVRPSRPSAYSGTTTTDNVPRIALARPPLRGLKVAQPPISPQAAQNPSPSAGLPSTAPPASTASPPPPIPTSLATTFSTPLELVWESSPLKPRSLQLSTGNASTNSTGSANLGKGRFTHIDQVTYFRNHVFGSLNWTLNSQGNTETVDHDFDIVIRGVMVGTFSLTLRHSLTRAAKASTDDNIPTGMSWNKAKPYVSKPALLGATMRLWRSTINPTNFRIDID